MTRLAERKRRGTKIWKNTIDHFVIDPAPEDGGFCETAGKE